MKDGSVRRGQKGLSGRRKVCPSTAGQPPLSRGTERLEARGSRGPARQTASLPLRGGRPRAGRDPGRGSSRRGSPRREDWGRGGAAAAAEAPRHLAGVPATRAGTRSAGRVDRTRSYPGTLGVRAGGKLTLRRLGSRCSSALRPSPGLGRPPTVASQGRQHSSQRTRRWGRETGPEVEGEAWRPWAGSTAVATTRGQRAKLRLCPTRQETFRPCQLQPP